MSTTLLVSDNMAVTGHKYIAPVEGTNGSQAIHLDFSLHMNGKLKIFGYSFLVEKADNIYGWDMVEWHSWNAMYYTLASLGYPPIVGIPQGFCHENAKRFIQRIMEEGDSKEYDMEESQLV